jgi:hypothetical protein
VTGPAKAGFARRLLEGNFVPPNSTLIRRSAVEKAGRFDTTLKGVDDFDFWYRIVRVSPATVYDKPLATWQYLNAQSISADDTLMVRDELRFYDKIVKEDDWEPWEKYLAVKGVARNQKLLGNRLLLAGKYGEAAAEYAQAGLGGMSRLSRIAGPLLRLAYLQKRRRSPQFQPLQLSFEA